MHAKVIRAFHHTNTGRTWLVGDTFSGDAAAARQLAARGYLRLPGQVPTTVDGSGDRQPVLAALTVAELRALCEKRGIDVPRKARKADLVAALGA